MNEAGGRGGVKTGEEEGGGGGARNVTPRAKGTLTGISQFPVESRSRVGIIAKVLRALALL